jgi:PKD repeat protein
MKNKVLPLLLIIACLLTAGTLQASAPPATPARQSENSNALNWLAGRQDGGGAWSVAQGLAGRDTAAAVAAFAAANNQGAAVTLGAGWLAGRSPTTTDSLARSLIALGPLGLAANEQLDTLAGRQLPDGSWGATAHAVQGNGFDTALVLQALANCQWSMVNCQSSIGPGLAYLISQQQADGGWALTPGTTSVQATATALLALAAYQERFELQLPIANGVTYLHNQQNANHSFGGGAADTGLAHSALWAVRAPNPTRLANARTYLTGSQLANGSWGNEVYATALAAHALIQAQQTVVTGRVVDISQNKAISGVTITVVGVSGLSATTDSSGNFTLANVPPGSRQLQASKSGYSSATAAIEVVSGETVDADAIGLGENGPAVSFIWSPTPGLEGARFTSFANPIRFTSTSTPLPGTTLVEYLWTATNNEEFRHTTLNYFDTIFPDNGVYTVTLSVRDSLGRLNTLSQNITINNVPPIANAGADVTTMAGIPVSFAGTIHDASANVDLPLITNNRWDFGIGGSGYRALNTAWTYTTPGTYIATLTTQDKDGGIGTDSRTITVLPNNPPTASFTVNPVSPLNEGSVTRFTDTSTDPDLIKVQLWRWNFGDGTTTGLKSPYHFFADNGNFNVTLVITDTGGASSNASLPFTIHNLPPVIGVTGPFTVPVGSAVNFSDRIADPSPVDDASLVILWDFGDGITSTLRNPSHTWATAGVYTLTVSAADKDGGSTVVTATVTAAAGVPVARIDGPRTFAHCVCGISYNGNPFPSDPTLTQYEWWYDGMPHTNFSFGNPQFPGLSSPTLGLHRLRVRVTNNAGLTSEKEIVIRVTPKTSLQGSPLSRTVTAGESTGGVFFIEGADTSLIDWGDGTSTVDNTYGHGAPHIYTLPGVYQATYYGSTTDGYYPNPVVATITVLAPSTPVVGFERRGIDGNLCPQLPPREGDSCQYWALYQFSPPLPSYTTDGSTWTKSIWNWGDSSALTVLNGLSYGQHRFAESGVYYVNLLALTSSGMTNTITIPITVTNRPPTADAGKDRFVIVGQETTIEGRGTDASAVDMAALTFHFNFGDGNSEWADYDTNGAAYARHTWNTPGTYNVTLTVSDPDGGVTTDVAVYTVRANRPPQVTSTPPHLATADLPFSYAVAAEDPDGDSLSYDLALAPEGMTVNAAGLIEWTPTFEQAGFHLIQLIVADPFGETAVHYFGLAVSEQAFTPDLVPLAIGVTAVTADPQTLAATGTVTATVKNFGIAEVTVPVEVTFFDDSNQDGQWSAGVDTILATTTIPAALSGDETVEVSATVSGNVLFRDNLVYVLVDSDAAVDEGAREDNNVRHSGDHSRYVPPAGLFAPELEWAWRGSIIHPDAGGGGNWSWVLTVPIVAPLVDTNGDGAINENDVPAVIFETISEHSCCNYVTLYALRGDSGEMICTVTERGAVGYSSGPGGFSTGELAVGDLDGDGRPEILSPAGSTFIQMRAYNNDCTTKWTTASVANTAFLAPRGGASLADLDGNGRLEVILGNMVWNYDGTVRWIGTKGKALTGSWNGAACCLSAVADLDMDGTPEVVTGNSVYRADGTLYWDKSGAPTNAPDGLPAVANFDGDPYPEIAVMSQVFIGGSSADGQIRLYEHDGTLKWGPVNMPGAVGQRGGGPPTVADFSGDGVPDIGVAGYANYAVFNGVNGSLLWSRQTQDNSSWQTGSSAFDFDGDGKWEIIYSDEQFVRIFRGSDGAVLWQTANPNGTFLEYPSVADVDGDGHAELLVARNQLQNLGVSVGLFDGGIFVYGDTFNNWRPARAVWNQHSYHITNVNDDGTIPAEEANSWTRYNSYRAQVAPDGVDPFAAPDLTASRLVLDAAGCNSALDITARVGNGGSANAPAGVVVAFYDDATLIGTVRTAEAIAPGHFVDVTYTWDSPPGGSHTIRVVVDDPDAAGGVGAGAAAELDEWTLRAMLAQGGTAELPLAQEGLTAEGAAGAEEEGGRAEVVGAGQPVTATLSALGSQLLPLEVEGNTTETTTLPASESVLFHPSVALRAPLEQYDPVITVPEGREDNNEHSQNLTLCDPGNAPPSFTTTAATTATVGVVYSYDGDASDANGDTLTYRLLVAPAGAGLDPATGLIRWQPTLAQLGNNAFQLQVADGRGGLDTQSWVVVVSLPPLPDVPSLCTIAGGVPGSSEIPGNGVDDDCNPETADSGGAAFLQVAIVTDKQSYTSHELAQLFSTVEHSGGSNSYTDLEATVVVRNAANGVVYTAVHPLGSLGPGQVAQLSDSFDTAAHAPGSFTAEISLARAGTPLNTDSAPFTVISSAAAVVALGGDLTPQLATIAVGQPLTVTWTAANVGNITVNDMTLRLILVNPANGTILRTYQETADLGLGASINRTTIFTTTGLTVGPVMLVLRGEYDTNQEALVNQTLASGGVTLEPGDPTAIAAGQQAIFARRYSPLPALLLILGLALVTAVVYQLRHKRG